MNVGDRIKLRRKELGLSVDDLAAVLNKDRSTIYRYESHEIEKMPTTVLKPLSKALQTTPAYLMGWESETTNSSTGNVSIKKGVKIPVLGTVRAGIPLEAVEEILDYEEISAKMATKGDFFGLQIKGDSMEPRFAEGDVVIIRKQNHAENGDIIVALVNGDEATIKKLKITDEGIMLIPLNNNYEPLFYNKIDIEKKPVKIIGKVVELRAKF